MPSLTPSRPPSLPSRSQHDVGHPQLITERHPPYKTIHVNAAWCRQCGYRADDLIGRPYSMLLGPAPAPSLIELLEHAFSSGRPVTCHAVYFTKSGLPWQAELTLSPLLDSGGSSSTYFVHLLRPVAEGAGQVTDAAPRVEGTKPTNGHASGGGGGAAAVAYSPSGHSVVSLGGLSGMTGHKGLANHFALPGATGIPQLLHDQQRLMLHDQARGKTRSSAKAAEAGATLAASKKRTHDAASAGGANAAEPAAAPTAATEAEAEPAVAAPAAPSTAASSSQGAGQAEAKRSRRGDASASGSKDGSGSGSGLASPSPRPSSRPSPRRTR